MKKYIWMMLLATAFVGCSSDDNTVDFSTDRDLIQVTEVGGTELVQIVAEGEWTASTEDAWIAISPANGRGTTTCKFLIDSAKTADARRATVRIRSNESWESKDITVEQTGYPYLIEVDKESIEVSNYAKSEQRTFDVRVRSNVDFDVKIPTDASWLSNEKYSLKLTSGIRPREVVVRFNWDINTRPEERLAAIEFTPKQDVTLSRQQGVNVKQQAAEPIEEGTRAGDSVALLSIARTLDMMESTWDNGEPMNLWQGVTLWEEGMEGCTPEKVGRVKYAQFFLFYTKEPLPFEVRYLTAAEELYIFSNANSFLYNLSTGEYISELTQLKRLTIGAYGLTELHPSFTNLKNLEYLNICSNNFQTVPDILTKENFPNLRALVMNANQRAAVYDLSNTTRTDLGGFIDEETFPVDLLKWDLDTLVLSVNHLQGELPDLADDPDFPYYTQQEIDAVDTLPQYLVDNRIKKVMPSTKLFAINANHFYGKLPDWLLYHPALDLWFPYSLVFPQDGRASNGRAAMFENEPMNMNYYYDIYTTKTKPTGTPE
ncbi:MAG: hypothetical protein Q4A18_00335 [Rikenellaceae bacterium]|nr:hypothetical protein [Rikenellaceae bacterium]